MTGMIKVEQSTDLSRYESHTTILGRDRRPILQESHNYISIRGYFNGPDTWVAQQKGQLLQPVDLQKAREKGLIGLDEFNELYDMVLARLSNAGYDGSLLEGNDILLALDPTAGQFLKAGDGKPEARICSFEFIRKR
jgi:hypothetical protein